MTRAGLVVLLLLVALVGQVRSAIHVRVGVGSDDDGVRSVAARAFRARVEALPHPRLHVSIAGPALWGYPRASELELVRAVMAGDPPLALVNSATLSNFSRALDVLDAPFLFRDRRHLDLALNGRAGRAMLDSLRPRGLAGLGFVGPTWRVMLSRTPLPPGVDMRDARVGSVQSASGVLFVEALGGEAVPAPLGRLPHMARDGFIDGADLDPCSAAAAGLLQITPYVLDTRHAVTTNVLIANAHFLETLSPAERGALAEGALAAASAANDQVARQWTLQQTRLSRAGRWLGLDEAQRAALEERVSGARRAVLARVPAELVHEVEAVRP